MRFLFFIPVFALILQGCVSNIYLVRHAERLDNSRESPLSAQGLAHAEALRDTLLKEGIKEIYSSVYLRTQQTAQPLATALRQEMRLYSPDTTEGLLPVLRGLKNKNVLVVGHSDNIPRLIKELTADSVYIAHAQYGDLFQVRVLRGIGGKEVRLLRRKF